MQNLYETSLVAKPGTSARNATVKRVLKTYVSSTENEIMGEWEKCSHHCDLHCKRTHFI